MRIVSFLVVLIGIISQAVSQIKFLKSEHDFGTITESNLPNVYEFEFVNEGTTNLQITRVEASCGCTSPNWPTKQIAPNGRGKITVSFASLNLIGVFSKPLEVSYTSNNTNYSKEIVIKGKVVKEELAKPNYEYSFYGGAKIEVPVYSKMLLYDNKLDTFVIRVSNSSSTKQTINLTTELPVYLTTLATVYQVEPMSFKNVLIIINPALLPDYGYNSITLAFKTSNSYMQYTGTELRWIKKQFFKPMSARKLKKQPKVKFSKTVLNFGNVDNGLMQKDTITITNQGKKDLDFKLISSECPCVRFVYPKTKLKPGESMKMSFTYDIGGRYGKYTQGVYFVCNDPTNSEFRIVLTAKLPDKPNVPCANCLK